MASDDKKPNVTNDVASATDGEADVVSVPKVPPRYADESFKLFSKVQVDDPTPEEALRIKKKLIWRIIPFLCVGYHLMYVDKQTVRQQQQKLSFGVARQADAQTTLYSWEVRPFWAF